MEKIDQKFAYKSHYLLCVESISNEFNNGENSATLFKRFHDFRALKNGPVEWDIYKNRDIIPGWKFSQSEKCFEFESITNITVEDKALIDNAFNRIKDFLEKFKEDPQGIIEFSHNLPLWQYSYYKLGEEERLLTNNISNRKLEYSVFDKMRVN